MSTLEKARDIVELKEALIYTKTVLRPEEAAKYMDISLSTLYKMTSAGILPFSKPNGKKIYFDRAKLDAWLLSKSVRTSDEKEACAATYINTHK